MVQISLFQELKYSETVAVFRSHRVVGYRIEIVLSILMGLELVYYLYFVRGNWIKFIITQLLPILVFLVRWAHIFTSITEESVTIIKDFGIQLCTKNVFGVESKRLLDREKVSRVFVHEFVEGSSIRYCLAFYVIGENKLLLAYRNVYPGLANVQRVFQLSASEVLHRETRNLNRAGFK